jgi:hypothetical protein
MAILPETPIAEDQVAIFLTGYNVLVGRAAHVAQIVADARLSHLPDQLKRVEFNEDTVDCIWEWSDGEENEISFPRAYLSLPDPDVYQQATEAEEAKRALKKKKMEALEKQAKQELEKEIEKLQARLREMG